MVKNRFLLGLFVAVCGLFLLTGCGGYSDKIVCTLKAGGEEVELTLKLKDDKVSGVSAVMTAKSTEDAEEAAEYYKNHGADVKVDGKKVTFEDFTKVDDSTLVIIGKTKDEVLKNAEEKGMNCK